MFAAVLPDFGFRVTLLPGRLRSRGGAALDRLVCGAEVVLVVLLLVVC